MVARALVGAADAPRRITLINSRLIAETADFAVETDYARGQVLAVTRLAPGAPGPDDPAGREKDARARLGLWGIPSAEMGGVARRASMLANQEGGVNSSPELHRYKTFFDRALGGVPIAGHRAVISHNADGRFARAYIKWPAIAASGHRLRTTLTVSAIEKAASDALVREGESGGKVALRWRLVSVAQTSGEVQLVLKVVASLKATAVTGGEGTERREVLVDVAAQ
jgi:hypothetical protein